MTSKELVRAALQGQPGPRVPTGPLAVHFCARRAGVSLVDYSTNARALADSVIGYWEEFRPDAVWLSADTWVSAEAMGAKVGATDQGQPLGGMGEPVVKGLDDVRRIPPPDVRRQGRYPLMLEALKRVVSAIGNEAFVVACFDQYPFSLAAALLGINDIMLRVRDDPGLVEALMARCAQYGAAYGRALARAGADMLSGGDSPAGLLGPKAYARVAWPGEQRLIAALKQSTALPISLHICGDATPIVPLMAASGADVLEIDHAVEVGQACRRAGPTIAIWGNVDPVGVLVEGTPEIVRQAARLAAEAARLAGHRRFILSSGCTLAVETPPENLRALLQGSELFIHHSRQGRRMK